VWELIAALVARSLVVAEDHGDETRYRLLETIRQYGEERLAEHGETAELRRRHARFYAELLATLWSEGYLIVMRPEAVSQLADEQDNIARAMAWALDTADIDLAFYLLRHAPNTEEQTDFAFRLPAEPVLSLPGATEHPAYPVGAAVGAIQAALSGDLGAGARYCEEALAAEARLGSQPDRLVEQMVALSRALMAMAVGAWRDSAVEQSRAADIAEGAGRIAQAATSRSGAGACYALGGDFESAISLATEAVELARRVNAPLLLVHCLTSLSNAVSTTDPQRARQLLQECFDMMAAVGCEPTHDVTQAALVAARIGDRRLALELAARSAPRLHWNGNRPQLAGVLTLIAWGVAPSEPQAAARLQGAARQLALSGAASASGGGEPTGPAGGATGLFTELRRETTHALNDALGENRLREFRAEGEAMVSDQAVAHAVKIADRVLASRS
jgi:hypothetical protein